MQSDFEPRLLHSHDEFETGMPIMMPINLPDPSMNPFTWMEEEIISLGEKIYSRDNSAKL